MIQLIEAPPRSGKTYYAVNYLSKYWEYDALYSEYIVSSDVLIISNIEGLKPRHWKYPECLKGRSLSEFFTIENFEKIMEKTGKNHVIIVLDEVHEIFPAKVTMKTNPELYEFFAYHGHIGLDVFLMTQGLESTSRIFNPLLEFVVKVKPRSQKVYKQFSYDYYSMSGVKLYSKNVTQDKKIFAAYKSFRKDETNKPKNALLKWVIYSLVMITAAVSMFSYTVFNLMNKGSVAADPLADPPGHEEKVILKRDYLRPEKPVTREASPAPRAGQIFQPPPQLEQVEEVSQRWRVYFLEGWLEKNDTVYYLINGKSFEHSDLFRNFSPISNTVEYFGQEIRSRG